MRVFSAKQTAKSRPAEADYTVTQRPTGSGVVHVPRGPPVQQPVAAPPMARPLAASNTAPLVSLTEADASALIAKAATDAAGPEVAAPADDLDSQSDGSGGHIEVQAGPMSQQQRERALEKISNRIGELLGGFEEASEMEEGKGAEADLLRLKDGITNMAGMLKKKGLMRVAFLQSAHQNMSKDRSGDLDDDSDGVDSDDETGAADVDPKEMIEAIQKKEQTKKMKLALVHQQEIGMLTEAARGLSQQMEETEAIMVAKTSQLEVDLSISREETKASTEERDTARAAAKKAEVELTAVSERLARQSNALEQAHAEADHMSARISALTSEVATEVKRNKEASAQFTKTQRELADLKARTGQGGGGSVAADPEASAKLDEAMSKIDELEASLGAVREEAESAKAEAAEAKAAAAKVKHELEEAQGEAYDAWNQAEEAGKEIDSLNTALDEARAELEKLTAEVDNANSEAAAASIEAAAATAAAAAAQATVTESARRGLAMPGHPAPSMEIVTDLNAASQLAEPPSQQQMVPTPGQPAVPPPYAVPDTPGQPITVTTEAAMATAAQADAQPGQSGVPTPGQPTPGQLAPGQPAPGQAAPDLPAPAPGQTAPGQATDVVAGQHEASQPGVPTPLPQQQLQPSTGQQQSQPGRLAAPPSELAGPRGEAQPPSSPSQYLADPSVALQGQPGGQSPAGPSQLPASPTQRMGTPGQETALADAQAALQAANTAAAQQAAAASAALRMARGVRNVRGMRPTGREENMRKRMEDNAVTDAAISLLRMEIKNAEDDQASAASAMEKSYVGQRTAAAAMHSLQASVWKATRSRVPAAMEEALEAAVGGVRAEWEAKLEEERRQWENRMKEAVTAARVETAGQANLAILVAEAAGASKDESGEGGGASGGGGMDERTLREQLEKLHKMHVEQTKAMTADFEARLAESRSGALGERITTLVARAAEMANSRPGAGPLAALLMAVGEIDVGLSEVLDEALRAAQRRQLLELTEAGRVPSNALDQAVRVAWEHLWELSLAPPGGREVMLDRMHGDYDEARSRVAAHISRQDETMEAAAVAERYMAVQRAEVSDGLTGYRRSVREMSEARENLAREQALSNSLRAELEAAYVSRATAERSATQRLEELNSLRGVLHKIQSDMRVSIQQQRTKSTAQAAVTAADAIAQVKRLPANARVSGFAVSAPSAATPNASPGVMLFTAEGGHAEDEAAGDGGASALTLRDELLDTLRQARTKASEDSGAVELLVHERAMLETLREEVERQKAMRLSAAQASETSREVELEALREEMSAAEARQAEVLKELSIAWQRESQQRAAANEAQIEMVQAEAEKRLAAAAAVSAATETALQIKIDQLSGGNAARFAAEDEANAKKHALEIDEVTRRANAEVERVGAAQNHLANSLFEALTSMQDHASAVIADATVLAPSGASASAEHPAATLAAMRALGAHGLSSAQRAADSMTRRLWVVCNHASHHLNLESPPPLRVDSTSGLPALAAAHATLLEQLLTVVRFSFHGSPSGKGAPSGAVEGRAARDGRRPLAAQAEDAPAMPIAPTTMDLSIEISRKGGQRTASPSMQVPRVMQSPTPASGPLENRSIARMEARHLEATRKNEAKAHAQAEQQRRSHELAMESFATIAYTGSQFGELRSCLDSTPISRNRPSSAEHLSHYSQPLAAWPGGRPQSSLAAVASTVDVVYSSAADQLKTPPPTLVSFEDVPLRPMSGPHLTGGGNVPALAVSVGRGSKARLTAPPTNFTRRQATSMHPPRNRPGSAAEGPRPSVGAHSTPIGMLNAGVYPGSNATVSAWESDGPALNTGATTLKRPKSAAALPTASRPGGPLSISTTKLGAAR